MAEDETTEIGDSVEAEFASTTESEGAATGTSKPRKTKAKSDGYIRIQLEESEEVPPSGLFIGVNGQSYLLQPGVEARVPQGVVDVLENAIMSVPRIDPQSKRVVGYKSRHRYPFRRL